MIWEIKQHGPDGVRINGYKDTKRSEEWPSVVAYIDDQGRLMVTDGNENRGELLTFIRETRLLFELWHERHLMGG